MNRITTVIVTGVIIFSMSGCGNNYTNSNLETYANEIVEAFEQSDIDAINTAIFNTHELNIDEELEEYFLDEQEDSGILSEIFKVGVVTVKKINEADSEIIYEVKAPDLSNVFSESADKLADMTETEFEQYLLNCIESADIVTASVSINYTYDGDVFSADYKTDEFINAITGGLLGAYQSLYQEMIDDYLQGMEEAE